MAAGSKELGSDDLGNPKPSKRIAGTTNSILAMSFLFILHNFNNNLFN